MSAQPIFRQTLLAQGDVAAGRTRPHVVSANLSPAASAAACRPALARAARGADRARCRAARRGGARPATPTGASPATPRAGVSAKPRAEPRAFGERPPAPRLPGRTAIGCWSGKEPRPPGETGWTSTASNSACSGSGLRRCRATGAAARTSRGRNRPRWIEPSTGEGREPDPRHARRASGRPRAGRAGTATIGGERPGAVRDAPSRSPSPTTSPTPSRAGLS